MCMYNTYVPCMECGKITLYTPYLVSAHGMITTQPSQQRLTCSDCKEKRKEQAQEKNPTLFKQSK